MQIHSALRTAQRRLTRQRQMADILLFDMDGTLYPNSNPYRRHVHQNLFEFMHAKLGIPRDVSAESIWRPIFDKYHQSERGFRAEGYNFDRVEYWRFIRSGVSKFISPDPALREFLSSLPPSKPRYIFTNAREEQAEETLRCLGVEDLFEGIFGADFMENHCKPEKEAFEKVLAALPAEPGRIWFFEDSFKNLMQGKRYGMRTILVESITVQEEGRTHGDYSQVDFVVKDLTVGCVKEAIPELWVEDGSA